MTRAAGVCLGQFDHGSVQRGTPAIAPGTAFAPHQAQRSTIIRFVVSGVGEARRDLELGDRSTIGPGRASRAQGLDCRGIGPERDRPHGVRAAAILALLDLLGGDHRALGIQVRVDQSILGRQPGPSVGTGRTGPAPRHVRRRSHDRGQEGDEHQDHGMGERRSTEGSHGCHGFIG